MTPSFVMEIGRDTLIASLWVVGPIMGVGFVVGLLVSLLQAVMQLQEMTLALVPKLFAIGLALILSGHWMLAHLMSYTERYLGGFSNLISS